MAKPFSFFWEKNFLDALALKCTKNWFLLGENMVIPYFGGQKWPISRNIGLSRLYRGGVNISKNIETPPKVNINIHPWLNKTSKNNILNLSGWISHGEMNRNHVFEPQWQHNVPTNQWSCNRNC